MPKHTSGLGIQYLGGMDQAFLMKLAWKIILDLKALWVIRAKYFHDDIKRKLPRHTKPESANFRTICKMWDLVMMGIYKVIMDGKLTSLWLNDWIPEIGPLFSSRSEDVLVDYKYL